MRAGVLRARRVRRSVGDKPKVSRPLRRVSFLDSPLACDGKAAIFSWIRADYTEATRHGIEGPKPQFVPAGCGKSPDRQEKHPSGAEALIYFAALRHD